MRLLSPVGDWVMLRAAVKAGCDEVYLGVKGSNMRASARNFEIQELKKIADFCHENNVKVNLTVNTIIYDNEIKKVEEILKAAKQAEIDAIICWDMAVVQLCRKLNLEFHISTQASVSNSESAEYYADLGASRIIFARECSLEQIKKIKEKLGDKIEIEVFGHGAMCVSVSGRCFMSQNLFGKSANRGECIQPCRREYNVKDIDDGSELVLGKDYVMSPKDLCTIPFLDKLFGVVDVIKLEGRMRSPEYVLTVTKCYREAISAITEGRYTEELKQKLMEDVSAVYNRGFSSGFFLGKPVDEWCKAYGSKATKEKVYVGVVKNYFEKQGVADILIMTNSVSVGDELMVQGNKTGVFVQKVESIHKDNKSISSCQKGDRVGIKLNEKVRPNDKVFVVRVKE